MILFLCGTVASEVRHWSHTSYPPSYMTPEITDTYSLPPPPPYSSSFPLPCQTMYSYLLATQSELNTLIPFLLDPFFNQDMNMLFLYWQRIYEWIENQCLPYCFENNSTIFCELCAQLSKNLAQNLIRQINQTLQAIQLKQLLSTTYPPNDYRESTNNSTTTLEPPSALEASEGLRPFSRNDSLSLMPPTTATSPHNTDDNATPHALIQIEEKTYPKNQTESNPTSHSLKNTRRKKKKKNTPWKTVPGTFPISSQVTQTKQSQHKHLSEKKPQSTPKEQKNQRPTQKKELLQKNNTNSNEKSSPKPLTSPQPNEEELLNTHLLTTFIAQADQALENEDYEEAMKHYENANKLAFQHSPEHQLKLQQIKETAEKLKTQDTHKKIFDTSQQGIQGIIQQPFFLENAIKAFKFVLIFKRTSYESPFYSRRLQNLLTLCEDFFQSASLKPSDWQNKATLCLKASDIFLELGLFKICFDNLTLCINAHSADHTIYLQIFDFLEQYISDHPHFPHKEAHSFLLHTVILLRTKILSHPKNAQWTQVFEKLGQLAPQYDIPINH